MIIHESFNDFVLFLYVHMAYADGEFHEKERAVILDKIAKLFPDENNPQAKLKVTESQYLALKKNELTEVISETFQRYSQIKSAHKYRIYTDMYDIIHADGKVEESETAALDELKLIINMGSRKG